MATHNYKPKTIDLASAASGVANTQNIGTSAWKMFLLKGTALAPDQSTPLQSGAIQIWYSTKSIGLPADQTTFTDANGRYGITCKAGKTIKVRFLGA